MSLPRLRRTCCAQHEQRKDKCKDEALDPILDKAAGQRFHNHSPLDFEKLKGDPDNIEKHLVSYIKGFSAGRTDRGRERPRARAGDRALAAD